jgi:hypothetical protein
VIPELETSDVELKAPPAKSKRDSFRQQLLLREGRVAGVARLAIAWTAPNPSDAGMRQAPVLDLASDEKAESFLVDSGLMGNSEPQSARFTGVSTPADVNP